MADRGQLNSAQARWYKGLGEEQLFDIRSYPEKLHNLAQHSDMLPTKAPLATALMARLAVIGNTATTDEDTMRTALLDHGNIPTTPAPKATTTAAGITLSSAVDASVGTASARGLGCCTANRYSPLRCRPRQCVMADAKMLQSRCNRRPSLHRGGHANTSSVYLTRCNRQ
jgi:hypothetical protein